MAMRFFLFLGTILLAIFGLHYLLYRNLVLFFAISNANLKLILFLILTLLSLSFVASFFLLFWQKNSLTIGFYIFAGSWLGIFINLLLAVGVIRLTLFLEGNFLNSQHTFLIGAIGLTGAILFSIYGFWSAFHPVYKTVQVPLSNLPIHWQGKKMVFLSDLHIGYVHRLGFLKRVVEQVNRLQPELIVITGDLFDGMGGETEPYVSLLNQFLAKKGVFFVSGNHEGYVGLTKSKAIIRQTQFTVLHNQVSDVDGIQLVGISYPGVEDASEIRNLDSLTTKQKERPPRILLFHTPTNIDTKPNGEASQHFSTYWGPDTSMTLNREIKADLQLSGHTHAGQLFPFTLLTRLIFKGYHYGLHREGDFSIYITSGVGTWGPPMRTGSRSEIVVLELVSAGSDN